MVVDVPREDWRGIPTMIGKDRSVQSSFHRITPPLGANLWEECALLPCEPD